MGNLRPWPAVALLLGGCWPHETRSMTGPESARVGRMISMISEQARRSNDPTDFAVFRAIDQARSEGRIGAFEDLTKLPDGRDWHGAVSLGRLYYHSSILDGRDSFETPCCPYPLEMLYHEGVHLTQSCLSLVFTPESAEGEARTEAKRFAESWGRDRAARR